MPASSSGTWARSFQRGEAGAIREVRRRVAKILAYRKWPIPRQERNDLEQEIVTELWQAVNRTRFDVSGGFWGFVEVVTSRRCIDWLRAWREQDPLPDEMESVRSGPLRRVLEGERTELATAALKMLDSDCRELINRRLHQGLSYGEIARMTGKSEGALRVQLHRCIRRGRKALEELTDKQ